MDKKNGDGDESLEHEVEMTDVGTLGLMSSIAPMCTAAKQAYDTCFNKWLAEEYLSGCSQDTVQGEQPCAALLSAYQSCLKPALQVMGKNYEPEELLREFPIIGTDKEQRPPSS